jgi:hypothetical protein
VVQSLETDEDGGATLFGAAIGYGVAIFVDKNRLMAAMNRIRAITANRCFMRPPAGSLLRAKARGLSERPAKKRLRILVFSVPETEKR